MKNTIRKTLLGLALGLFTSLSAHSAVLYQQDFTTFVPPGDNPAANGWLFPWNDAFQIGDQGTGTGNVLFHIGGFSQVFTTPLAGNETQIVVKSLIWPQVGTAYSGLTSTGYNNFGSGVGAFTDQWYGFGPRMVFTAGANFSLQRGGSEGGGTSSAVAVSGVTAGNANFSLVIDVTTGLADGFFGSPESGTLLVDDFDLVGTSTLSAWQANVLSMNNFVVGGNQALHDNLEVSAIPEPSTYAMLLAGMGALVLAFRRRRTA